MSQSSLQSKQCTRGLLLRPASSLLGHTLSRTMWLCDQRLSTDQQLSTSAISKLLENHDARNVGPGFHYKPNIYFGSEGYQGFETLPTAPYLIIVRNIGNMDFSAHYCGFLERLYSQHEHGPIVPGSHEPCHEPSRYTESR